MIQYIHLSQTLGKGIKRLRKTGKQGEQAVNSFEEILSDLKNFSCRYKATVCKRTKNGEQRIRNCIKYDLGGGYRLVTVRVNDHLYIPFLGSHDETDQWFHRHRNDIFKPDASLYYTEELIPLKKSCDVSSLERRVKENSDDQYEEQLQAKIDEPLLKSVFRGLFRNCSSPTT
jgi:hypothetical protein